MKSNFNVILLHDKMNDKQGDIVTTSLTMIDLHDISRSATTYNVDTLYIAHPAPALRKLARTLKGHWESGYGSDYNPDRKEALDTSKIVSDLDEAILDLENKYSVFPKLIASSAIKGDGRMSFKDAKKMISEDKDQPYLLMLGTGWGMSDELLAKADYFLEPIDGPTNYNHLSVRSACAIMLDRIFGL